MKQTKFPTKIPRNRKFGGLGYYLDIRFGMKSFANANARQFRDEGGLARVVEIKPKEGPYRWAVYKRAHGRR